MKTTNRYLFIGDSASVPATLQDDKNSVVCLPTYKEALAWMLSSDQRVLSSTSAIFIHIRHGLETLVDFNKAKSLISPDLCATPLFVWCKGATVEQKQQAIKYGADDIYSDKIDIKDLQFRVNFLRTFKLSHTCKEGAEEVGDKKDFKKILSSLLKRSVDITVSFLFLVILSPLMLIVAIAIRLDSKGPIFYISKRAGSAYKVFNFYKFRTMRVGADAELAKLNHLNQYQDGEKSDSVFFKLDKDPRVTRLGQFLRKTSLDEIPQLLNVLKGDMSLVGNRPLPLYEARQLTKDEVAQRFLAPAGITGLWQVKKRGKKEMSVDERIQLDVAYANDNSFASDVKLMLETFPALIQKEQV